MAQNNLSSSLISTSEALEELKLSRVLIDAFWDRWENFDRSELSKEQSDELDCLIHLIHLYESTSLTALTQLTKGVTAIQNGYREMKRRSESP